MATLGELVVSLSANTAQFTSAMDKAAYTSQKRMDDMLAGANRLGAALGTALAGGALGFAAAMKLAVNRLDELGENAQKLGLTTEALSGLEYVAGLSGVTVETLHGSMNKLNKSIADGNPAFAAMGISVQDANGQLKTADVIVKEVAAKFAGYKEGAEKSALAMELMGKSGAEMVPMLNQGADGFASLTAEAEKMGLVISNDVAESAGKFNDNLDRILKTQSGLVTQLTAELLPVMERVSDEFVTLAKNADLVSGPATAIKTALQTVAVVGSDVSFVFTTIGKDVARMIENVQLIAKGDWEGSRRLGELFRADAAAARAELDAFQARIMGIGQVAEAEAKKAENGGGIAAPIVKAAEKAKKAKKEMDDLLAPAAREYARAIEQMNSAQRMAEKSTLDLNGAQSALHDLMADPLWQQMPKPWQETAIAQAKSASALIEVANRQKRINDMLAATPTAKLEESRAAMLLLKEEFEAGNISAEQFSEAAGTHLGTLPQIAEKAASNIDIVIGNAFSNAADAIADFAMGGKSSFSDMIMAMIRDLIKLQAQMAMTEAFKSAGGSSGIASLIGSVFKLALGSSSTSGLDAASTGAYSSGGTYVDVAHSGGLVGSSSFAQRLAPSSLFDHAQRFHDGGWPGLRAGEVPIIAQTGERVLNRQEAAEYGQPAAGANVTVNVINNTDAQTRTQERSDARGNKFIDVIIEQVKGSIASDISRGSGAVPNAMQGVYGLNRQAGAY